MIVYYEDEGRAPLITYFDGTDGVCPHCNKHVNFISPEVVGIANNQSYKSILGFGTKSLFKVYTGLSRDDYLHVGLSKCPSCKKLIVSIDTGNNVRLGYPTHGSKPVHQSVPTEIAKDYQESLLVLQFSSNASAALSRRCLENILVGQGFNDNKLSKKIEKAMPSLPSYIKDYIDSLRLIGNLAAHPNLDECSGAIVDVDEEEAKLMITVLEELFDHYYIKPQKKNNVVCNFKKKTGKNSS